MKYGLYVPNFGVFGDPHNVIRLAKDAEENGWDGLFLWDHISSQPLGPDSSSVGWNMADPWIALAGAAVVTSRVRLGTAVTPIPRRRPQKIARETVTLDRLSNGRVVLGVGSGGGTSEYDLLGEETDARIRGEMLDEALDVITRLWSGSEVNHIGAHYRVEGAHFLPTPVQQPRIPIWVGGFWPHRKPMRRAARWDGVMPLMPEYGEREFQLLKECVDYVYEQRTGGEPFDVVYASDSPGDRPDEAAELVGRFRDLGVTWWLESIAPYRFKGEVDDPWDFELLRERVLQGPPAV
jgi:probable F420-dependent oxidoreductase